MAAGLPVIIVDDDPVVCDVIASILERFYSWGEIITFTDFNEALLYCMTRETGVAIFILDVYMGGQSGFAFLEAIHHRFPVAHQDTIIITGAASDDVVNRCIAADITYLLEKPVRAYALQLAVRAIVAKYLKFAKRLLEDPSFAENVSEHV
jgi:response regulator of citrate/malate metabolism